MGLTQVGTGGIKDDAVTSGKILDSEIETSDIKDEAVTLAKLPKGDSNSNGKVLTSNNNAAPTFNTPTVEGVDVKSDGITATSPYKFLRADGDNTCSWQAPAGTSLVTDDANGLVPPHPASNENPTKKFLRGDLTWDEPSLVTTGNNGLVPPLPASTENPTLKFLRGDRSWQELNYTVSGTTTGNEGTAASVSISGNAFSFTIPKGDKGDEGDPGNPGTNATVGVHSTVTGNAGSDASVTNEGTSSAASFKFTIPRGNTGNTGASGKTILNGSGAPTGSTGGNVGDFYIDTTNNNIYGPKESGGWVGPATSLVGPAGSDAEVTSTNVNTAGAVMNSDLDGKGEILVGDGTGDPTALAVGGTNGHVLMVDSSESTGVKWASHKGLFTSYARLEDQKTHNVNGGQASQGNQVRDLNTEKFDPDGIILGFNGNATSGNLKANGTNYSETTVANQFVLGAGTYLIRASTPQLGLARVQTRLGALVGSAYAYVAASPVSFSNTTVEARPELFDRFTISQTMTYAIIMWCQAASTNSYAKGIGSGSHSGYGTSLKSIYTVVDIYKE